MKVHDIKYLAPKRDKLLQSLSVRVLIFSYDATPESAQMAVYNYKYGYWQGVYGNLTFATDIYPYWAYVPDFALPAYETRIDGE